MPTTFTPTNVRVENISERRDRGNERFHHITKRFLPRHIQDHQTLLGFFICKTFENEWRGRGYLSVESQEGRRVEEEVFHEQDEEEEDASTISTLVRCLGNDIMTSKRKYFGSKGSHKIVVVSRSRTIIYDCLLFVGNCVF